MIKKTNKRESLYTSRKTQMMSKLEMSRYSRTRLAEISKYQAKYPKATHCLERDQRELLTFYDFPGDHWKYIETTNSIE